MAYRSRTHRHPAHPPPPAQVCDGTFEGPKLDLSGLSLTGTLPASLANLSLTDLVLSSNLLSGTVPRLPAQLQTLDLNNNRMSGTIPPRLNLLAQLRRLDLYNNRLSGTIPSFTEGSDLAYLSVGANSLSGSLPPSIGSLTGLETLDVSKNSLSGALPSELGDLALLTSAHFRRNGFSFPSSRAERLEYDSATRVCRPDAAACLGVPPGSCSAFGDARLSITDPTQCEHCGSIVTGSIIVASVAALAILALVAFIRLVVRQPASLKRWVSTAVILISHAQTFAVIGSLHLDWPDSVLAIAAAFRLDFISIPAASCFLSPVDAHEEGDLPASPFWLYAIVVCGGSFTVLLTTMLAPAISHRLRMRAARGSAELVLSIVFALLFTMCWSTIFTTVVHFVIEGRTVKLSDVVLELSIGARVNDGPATAADIIAEIIKGIKAQDQPEPVSFDVLQQLEVVAFQPPGVSDEDFGAELCGSLPLSYEQDGVIATARVQRLEIKMNIVSAVEDATPSADAAVLSAREVLAALLNGTDPFSFITNETSKYNPDGILSEEYNGVWMAAASKYIAYGISLDDGPGQASSTGSRLYVLKSFDNGYEILLVLESAVADEDIIYREVTLTPGQRYPTGITLDCAAQTIIVTLKQGGTKTHSSSVRYAPLKWSSPVAVALLSLLSMLLLLLLFLPLHFARQIDAFTRGREDNLWRAPSFRPCLPLRCLRRLGVTSEPSAIFPRHLERQVAYLTGRFAPHAPRWQLVVWLRQFSLMFLVFACDLTRVYIVRGLDPMRYAVACSAIVIVTGFWLAHRRVLPYAYDFQNAMESLLLGATVLLLALSGVYNVSRGASVSLAVEVLMCVILLGSITAGATYSVHHLRRSRRILADIDLTEVLVAADSRIDGKLVARLRDGSVRLLRCDWLASESADAFLGRDADGTVIMKRCQDLPAEAFVPCEEAVALLEAGDRSVLSLSYGWLTPLHPDPHGTTLAAVRRYLASGAGGVGLFWDFAALPQKDEAGHRSLADVAIFARGIEVMGSLYASITGTAVLQQRQVVVPAVQSNRPEDIQRQWLQRQMDYNERPYENRGWCLFEQGVAMTVAAHLAAAEAQAARAGKELPLRFRRAQEFRAKVYDIGGPEPVVRSCAARPPLEVLEEACGAIGSSRFTGKGDAEKVLQMLAEFEWIVRSTFQQALECEPALDERL
ncbi:hypothetical protein EMIHUDRAFT_195665 [Emiliania huxleyi CCMP1516]|uniref:Uncharacterized protein n=2 Tax=Emiliania huxleyi TaxID=2903 RepID=A0A0D3JHV5_EMIH1|nr:hypothetical protein EMIHUDRAFT_195665 [Emiliania huxleyi CCMP1516]EOD23090.1 hypothetical protein EMIHUDRAFT_195665 [Emiliania huxleyi CCMP1516]|eukprot:XP_005775519.1 hypothetical protein EMIHUDRAFT_195665 [Emiliania huxleyi CCMP1516]